jgi:hypothetical protein
MILLRNYPAIKEVYTFYNLKAMIRQMLSFFLGPRQEKPGKAKNVLLGFAYDDTGRHLQDNALGWDFLHKQNTPPFARKEGCSCP